jgi:cytochrome P450
LTVVAGIGRDDTLESMRAPGPRGWSALTAPFRLQRDPLGALDGLVRQHGDLVSLRLGPQRAFVVARPEHVRRVLVDEATRYRKPSRTRTVLAGVLGKGLFTSEGDHWRRSRRLAQPFFQRQALADAVPILNEAAARMVARLAAAADSGQPIDVATESTRLSMHVAGRLFLGVPDVNELDELIPVVAATSEFVASQIVGFVPLPAFVPTRGGRAYRTLSARMDRIADTLLAERRKTGQLGGDFVGKLLTARDPKTGESYTDREIRDELATFFLAGHDTIANALTWAFYLVSAHPDVAARIRDEEASVLGGRAPTVQDLMKLEYTSAAVDETNRLYPQAWAMTREAALDDDLDGVAVPKGSLMLLAAWVTHRNPAIWPDPERFDPDRFSEARAKDRPRGAYFPFGAGQRQCIGSNLSMLEAAVALVHVMRAFDLRVVDGHPIVPRARFALDIKGGLPMLVTRRAQKAAVA